VVVVTAEKNGRYDRAVIIFGGYHPGYTVRFVTDVTYGAINLAVLDSGLCALLSEGELEMFVDNTKCETLASPPFDSTMPLFATSDGLFFVNSNSYYQVRKSK
jgi:hypothetical protein